MPNAEGLRYSDLKASRALFPQNEQGSQIWKAALGFRTPSQLFELRDHFPKGPVDSYLQTQAFYVVASSANCEVRSAESCKQLPTASVSYEISTDVGHIPVCEDHLFEVAQAVSEDLERQGRGHENVAINGHFAADSYSVSIDELETKVA